MAISAKTERQQGGAGSRDHHARERGQTAGESERANQRGTGKIVDAAARDEKPEHRAAGDCQQRGGDADGRTGPALPSRIGQRSFDRGASKAGHGGNDGKR